MGQVKVAAHTRKIKGKSVKVEAYSYNSPRAKGLTKNRKKRVLTDSQKKERAKKALIWRRAHKV